MSEPVERIIDAVTQWRRVAERSVGMSEPVERIVDAVADGGAQRSGVSA
ncbi:hypothetical protein [Micromonospora sp. NPDC003241]